MSRKDLHYLIKGFTLRRNGNIPAGQIPPLARGKRYALKRLEELWEIKNLPASRRICPECGKAFSRVYINGVEIDICTSCRSMWLDKGELQDLANLKSEKPVTDYIRKSSRYNCPVCHRKMYEHLLFSRSDLLVDICSGGDGIYLESGELEKVLQFEG